MTHTAMKFVNENANPKAVELALSAALVSAAIFATLAILNCDFAFAFGAVATVS